MMVMELRAGEGEGGEERGGERRGGGTFWLAFGFFWGGGRGFWELLVGIEERV